MKPEEEEIFNKARDGRKKEEGRCTPQTGAFLILI
jgi:hypothetical protein